MRRLASRLNPPLPRRVHLPLRILIGGLMVTALAIPGTIALSTAQTSTPNNRVSLTSLYSPTGLGASFTASGAKLTWTAASPNSNGNGNGYAISGVANGNSSTCPTTASSYTIFVGGTAGTSYTDSSSSLLSGTTWSYVCYLVQTGYNPVGGPPWASLPQWTSSDVLQVVAVRLTIIHVQNACPPGNSGTSLTSTMAGAVAAGDLLVGVFRANTPQTVSDNVNGAWTQSTLTGGIGIWYLQNSRAAAAGALTITLGAGSSGNLRICADEFSGIATTNALDQKSTGSVAASPWTAAATAAVPAAELVFAGIGTGSANETLTAGTTNGAAMTMGGQTTGATGTSGTEYLLSAVAGSQNSTMFLNPSTAADGGQATFQSRP